MTHIRFRGGIKLNGDHQITPEQMATLKQSIATVIAQHLPAEFAVNEVKITRINEAKNTTAEE